jgi:2,3-bisphosphoglycerate-independent phosphoglycerate mutase
MPVSALIILDGWGCRESRQHNAIAMAHKPYFDSLWNKYPHTTLEASGPFVGLPKGVMGNSEVGHLTLGAGRIVSTGLTQIYQAIDNGSFGKNPALLGAIEHVRHHQSRLHFLGLVSDGAVHSHLDHLLALLDWSREHGVASPYVHVITDCRDTDPHAAPIYLERLLAKLQDTGGHVASIAGRYYAMDRDQRWERTQKAYDVLCGQGPFASNAMEVLREQYGRGVSDEFIVPTCLVQPDGQPVGPIGDNDAVVFFNFRADRARQMTQVFKDPGFASFPRWHQSDRVHFVCMSPYTDSLKLPVAFVPELPDQTLGEILAQHHIPQLRLAETEKYAHVTYFFSGGRERLFDLEERCLIASPKDVATYDEKPSMSADQVTEAALAWIERHAEGVMIINFANPDMVGHTANEPAIIEAIEVVDRCLSRLVSRLLDQEGQVLLTADHGNADETRDAQGRPQTAHSLSPVPLLIIGQKWQGTVVAQGKSLIDVAPTFLGMIGLPVPKAMTGLNLV